MDRLEQVKAAIDDPCDEGGYDTFCRDRLGAECPEHSHCTAPHYPCIGRLRERLARAIIAENDRRRGQ